MCLCVCVCVCEMLLVEQVATMQMRLERMGRMEASMAAARRDIDDTGAAVRRRIANAAIAVGATSCGALAAWLIVSRLYHTK